MKKVVIFTDGSCEGNPGSGGYAAVLRHAGKMHQIGGGFRLTTNNRMELMGALKALELLKQSCVGVLYSDSAYVVNAVRQGWARKWRAANWRRGPSGRFPVLNSDLWKPLLEQTAKHQIDFVWVKGHSGVADNERCDMLAKQWAQKEGLPVDKGYENENPQLAT